MHASLERFPRDRPKQATAFVVGEALTLLEPQSRSGDKPVKFQVVLSPNGTAVLKGLRLVLHKICDENRPKGIDILITRAI